MTAATLVAGLLAGRYYDDEISSIYQRAVARPTTTAERVLMGLGLWLMILTFLPLVISVAGVYATQGGTGTTKDVSALVAVVSGALFGTGVVLLAIGQVRARNPGSSEDFDAPTT